MIDPGLNGFVFHTVLVLRRGARRCPAVPCGVKRRHAVLSDISRHRNPQLFIELRQFCATARECDYSGLERTTIRFYLFFGRSQYGLLHLATTSV
jgi:hypothetical protein